ncbi:MAG TPA: CHAT domain-containing protein [Archangium sp.]|uniref:CHAT domain-containing protein n=1 Tax=Archangium sp. TaxID=1872627 RepID=UPI002EDACC3E
MIRLSRRFFQQAREERSTLFRLTVRSTLAEVLGFPWWRVLSLLSRHRAADALDRRIAIIARSPEQLEPRPTLRPPLTVRVDGQQGRLTLDPFTQQAIRVGLLEVQYDTSLLKEMEEVEEVEGVHVLAENGATWGSRWGARLLVIEVKPNKGSLSAQPPPGVDAVLLVSGPEEARRVFFQHFYRAVLHNQPLEQCVREAFAASPSMAVQVAFGAREGGEYGLLFTRAAAELREHARDPLPMGGPDSDADQTLERIEARLARETPVLESSRVRRHVRTFLQSLNTSIRTTHAQLDAQLATLEGLAFSDKPRVLSEVAQSFQALDSDVEKVQEQRLRRMNTGSLVTLLENVDDRELQRGFTRLLNVWLSQKPGGPPVDRTRPLSRGAGAWLHIKISPAAIAEAFSATFPDFQVDLAFGREPLRLTVCIFHDAAAVQVEQPRGELLLPRRGESTEFRTYLRPNAPGRCRLRVCLFHQGTLLQSLVVEAELEADGPRTSPAPEGAEPIRYALDYVASPDFLLLEQHTPPVLSLVTNHAAGGEVWLGVFSSQEPGHGGMRTGTLHTFPEERLSTFVQRVRRGLLELQKKEGSGYQGPPDASNQTLRVQGLVQLASQGARLYNGLFSGNLSLSNKELQTFQQGLRQPGLISVARCNLSEHSIPWAMLYDLPLDTGNPAGLKLCPVFLKQLETQEDRLDAPESCRTLPECPLRGAQARQTVCPFGFWGIHHQIEQPLKQLRVEDLKELPSELASAAFAESCQLLADPAPPQAFMGYDHQAHGVEEHYQELHQLEGWALARSAVREEVIEALEQEPDLLYLYCHGHQKEGVFKLGFQDAFIEATSLQFTGERKPFFVFLNACDSVATLPETLNTFLGTLIRLGALAVIGSEITISAPFARQFARRLLEDFLAGKSLGAAFLSARRHFLRQLNPLALAYTLHAAADVHLHAESCDHCAARSRAV